jgi:hypothetical protein
MNRRLDEYRSRHDKLGAARDSSDSQSYHLQRIQKELQSLVQDALDGRTDRSDFASFFDGSLIGLCGPLSTGIVTSLLRG